MFKNVLLQRCIDACLPAISGGTKLSDNVSRQANRDALFGDFSWRAPYARSGFDFLPLFIRLIPRVRICIDPFLNLGIFFGCGANVAKFKFGHNVLPL